MSLSVLCWATSAVVNVFDIFFCVGWWDLVLGNLKGGGGEVEVGVPRGSVGMVA